jgi:O-antigen biosynthesis protein
VDESNGAAESTSHANEDAAAPANPVAPNRQAEASCRLPEGLVAASDSFAGLCTPDDVNTVYKLLLGRLPENTDVVIWYTQQTLAQLTQATISSVEFATFVNDLESSKGYIPHSRLGRDALKSATKWLAARLSQSVSATDGKAIEWQDLLASFVSSWPVWKFFQDAFGSRSGAIFTLLIKRDDRKDDEWKARIDVATADEIRGWIYNPGRTGITRASFYANGIFIGMAECNLYRRDVKQNAGGSGICGFKFKPIISDLILGGARCKLTAAVTETGEPLPIDAEFCNTSIAALRQLIEMQANVAALSDRIGDLIRQLPAINSLTSFPIENYSRFCELYGTTTPSPNLPGNGAALPKISVIVPIYKPPRMFLRAAIESVRRQSHPNWELILVNDAPEDCDTVEFLHRTAAGSNAIRVVEQETNTGLAGALNAGIAAATGDYISFLDHDDVLDKNALAWCAHAIVQTGAKFIYSDEDRFHYEDERKIHHHPFFKTSFDYDLLLERNYICHLVCICSQTLRAAGGMRLGYEGVQDHELFIRLAEMLPRSEIVHIPLVLYHWNIHFSSYSMTKENVVAIESRLRKVIAEHLERTGQAATVTPHEDDFSPGVQFCCSLKWRESSPRKKLAIIIPTRDRVDYLAPCIESIRKNLSDPQRCEIIILDNRSEQVMTQQYFKFLEATGGVRVFLRDEDFNWSRLNNYAVNRTDAEYMLFMNNDMVVLSKGFDEEVCGLLDRPDVGIVGARLLYEDGTIQHAGVAIGVGGVGGHVGLGDPAGHGVYDHTANLVHNVSCVTGAFMGVSKATFNDVSGFDEDMLKVAFNDVDFCLKVRKLGKNILYTPKITCYHYESVSRGYDYGDPAKAERANAESLVVKRRWGKVLHYDMFYNGVFDRNFMPYKMIKMPSADYISEYMEMQVEQAAADERWRPFKARPGVEADSADAVIADNASRRGAATKALASS